MDKKRNLVMFVSILVIVICAVLIVLMVTKNENAPTNKEENLNVCQKILNKISSNEKTVLIYENNNSIKEDIDLLIDELENNYKLSNLFRINSSCIDKVVNEETLNDISSGDVSVILYENGENIAFSVDSYDYYDVEEFLDSNKFIEKKVIEENITLNEIKDKINQDKYVLLIVQNQKFYTSAKKLMDNNYPEFSYDIINYRGNEGSKVYDYLVKNYSLIDEIPQFVYFNKGKKVSNDILEEAVLSTVLK